jgi:hypothetical protein
VGVAGVVLFRSLLIFVNSTPDKVGGR